MNVALEKNDPYFSTGGMNPLHTISTELTSEISSMSYLGPLRSPPARHYIVSGSERMSVGTRGEMMPQLLHRRRGYTLQRLNSKFNDFGIPYSIDVKMAGNALTGDIIAEHGLIKMISLSAHQMWVLG